VGSFLVDSDASGADRGLPASVRITRKHISGIKRRAVCARRAFAGLSGSPPACIAAWSVFPARLIAAVIDS
jgi:hypothetical protein